MKTKIALLLLIAVFSGAVAAAPAVWYQWRSKLDGRQFCAQTSPGDGWEKDPRPYRNGRCAEK